MRETSKIIGVRFLLLLFFITSSCNTNNGSTGYRYVIPQQTNDGWETASLNSLGMDEGPLEQMMNILK